MTEIERLNKNIEQTHSIFTDIKKSIENNGVSVPSETLASEYAPLVSEVYNAGFAAGQESGSGSDRYDEGYEAGAKSEYDKFWDDFQDNGNRTDYSYAFYGNGAKWGNTFAPKYDIVPTKTAASMFQYNYESNLNLKEGLAKNGVKFDLSKCPTVTSCFNYARVGDLPELNLTSVSTIPSMFHSCKSKVIDKIILKDDGSQIFKGTFEGFTNLEEVRFGGVIGQNVNFSPCTKLSHDSLIDIIEHLATTSETRTLSLGATNLNKLTDEEKAIATEKGWTLA